MTRAPQGEKHESDIVKQKGADSRSRRRWLWLLAAVLLVVGGYFFWGRAWMSGNSARKGGREPRAVAVTTATARKGDIGVYIDGLGTVTPLNIVTVQSRVDGQLMSVHFKEGDIVKKGKLLAEIDPRPFQAQLTQAEGQLIRDQAQLRNAKIDLRRYETLIGQDSISQQEYETQKFLVKQLEGAVKIDQGLIETARLQLIYCRITAPITGRVGLRQVDPGNIIHTTDIRWAWSALWMS